MNYPKILLSTFVLMLFGLTLTTTTKAIDVAGISLKDEKSIPGSTTYPFKRLKEKLGVFLTFSKEKKINYPCSLLDTRLSELALLVDKKVVNEIERAGQRYQAQAGACNTEILKTKKEQHQKVLAVLRDNFPANSTYWLTIQQDIDTLDILSQ